VLLEQKRRHWNQMVTVQLVPLERREKLEQTVLTLRKETLDQNGIDGKLEQKVILELTVLMV
jgi:hypothetical protein